MISGTKKEVLDLLKHNGTLSIDQAVEQTDYAKTTLREHFLMLERDGYISRTYVRSGPGRPSLHYQLTKQGNSLYPSYESEVLKEFMLFLKRRKEDDVIQGFFEHFWDQRLQEARKRLNLAEGEFADPDGDLTPLMEMLEEEGFMPEISQSNSEDGQTIVKECNCPFTELIKVTKKPCKLEADFYRDLFGTNIKRFAFIPGGDFSCSYQVSSKEKSSEPA